MLTARRMIHPRNCSPSTWLRSLADHRANSSAASVRALFIDGTSQNRFAILFRIGNVKRAETRERKIREYVAMLERGDTIYPQLRRES